MLRFCKDGDSGIEMPQRCSALRSTGEGVPGTKTTPVNGGSGVAKEFGIYARLVTEAQLENGAASGWAEGADDPANGFARFCCSVWPACKDYGTPLREREGD